MVGAGGGLGRSAFVSSLGLLEVSPGWLGWYILGHLNMQFAKAKGIGVIAVDARDEGWELCKQAGSEHIFDARAGKDKVVQGVQQLRDGLRVKAAINVSEHEISAPLACAIIPMHGVVVEIAQPDTDAMPLHGLIFRAIQLTGSRVAGQEQSQETLNEAGKHSIKVETNLFYSLEEASKTVGRHILVKWKARLCVLWLGLCWTRRTKRLLDSHVLGSNVVSFQLVVYLQGEVYMRHTLMNGAGWDDVDVYHC
jgi:Zinc-binding dehydrogenase